MSIGLEGSPVRIPFWQKAVEGSKNVPVIGVMIQGAVTEWQHRETKIALQSLKEGFDTLATIALDRYPKEFDYQSAIEGNVKVSWGGTLKTITASQWLSRPKRDIHKTVARLYGDFSHLLQSIPHLITQYSSVEVEGNASEMERLGRQYDLRKRYFTLITNNFTDEVIQNVVTFVRSYLCSFVQEDSVEKSPKGIMSLLTEARSALESSDIRSSSQEPILDVGYRYIISGWM
ncbi:MAG: hypothetical protein HN411_05110 [Waddliaceae bacterium]|jgi:hypothetical protein|nr:hypothetical protein [Waddliaceae bacterium]MBT3579444.1 hypothetical protein [Waddliaceae bacterium]MBT4445159.1 hypothetical protein [Waddliaceae bacterium]MBT6928943.1 hypothetical protein [Waddliaceae bacterium]MBT7264471.1 hypothetical protein [Waddliaceae bacterium]